MPQLLQNDHRFGGPPILRPQPQELSPYLGAPVVNPTADVSTSTTTSVVTIADVLVGETVVFEISTRGGSPSGVVSVSGLPADTTREIIRADNTGSPSLSLIRVFFPSGLGRGTTVTFTFDGSPTKKNTFATKYANLANRPAIASATFTAVSGTALTAGTTAAFTEPGIHIAAWARGGSILTQTTTSGVDEEGTFQARVDMVGGVTTPTYLFVEDRPVTAPHPGGVTSTATASNGNAYAAIQAVWSFQDVVPYDPPNRLFRLGPRRIAGPPVLAIQVGVDAVAAAGNITITPSVAGATATANTVTIILTVAPGVADSTATANGPTIILTIPPAVAGSAASALGATVLLVIPPGVAAATASALGPQVFLKILAGVAAATGSGLNPNIFLIVLPGSGSATAGGLVPTLLIGLFILPAVSTANASGLTPTLAATLQPGVSTSTAAGLVPTLATRLLPSVASATAAALLPTLFARILPAATAATAAGVTPTIRIIILPAPSAAAAAGSAPTLVIGGVVTPAATVAMFGYVTGTPGSGTVASLGDQGLVIVGSSGTLGQTGSTGLVGSAYAPQDVCVLGYSNQVLGGVLVGDVETLIGRSFHGLRQNQAYTTTGVAGAVTEYDAGRTTSYRAIQFDAAPGGWAAVATGVADTQLTAFCTAVTNANRWTPQNPFLVCLHHEATLSPFGTAGFSATDYKAMWAHCVPLMLATGAPIAFAYVGWDRMFVGANGVGPPTAGQGVDDLDPGSSLYTYIGSDVYNSVDSPGVLRYGLNAGTLLEPVRLAAVARGKDWMIGEMGCEDAATQADHTNKAQWLDSLRVYLDGRGTQAPGVCRVMLTTIKTSAENYQVDSSAESLAAWRRLGFDVYYS